MGTYMNIETQTSTAAPFDLIMESDHKGRILVSGSNNDTRYMMRVLLELWGYEVEESAGEDETVLAAEHFLPNVILIDASRLFDDDLKIVSRLRITELTESLPIFVLSGYTQQKYQRAAFDHGATNMLAKPLDLDLLEVCLEAALPV